MDQPAPTARRRIRPAILFAAAAVVLIAASIAVLALDAPVARRHNPRTRNAYVGGDVTAISAHIQGTVVSLPIADNQQVHAGDLIAQIYDADYRAQYGQAQAALQAAHAQLNAIEAQQRVLQTAIGQSRSAEASSVSQTMRTSPELARQRLIIHTDAGVRTALERAEADQKEMEANVAASRAALQARELQVDVLDAQHRAAEAAIAARKADVALATLNLGWTRIVAPIDGTLSTRAVRVGDLLTPGTPIIAITPLDRVWVDANFVERQLPFIRTGQRAILRIDSFPGLRLDAHVAGLSPATGNRLSAVAPDNSTGNFTKVSARIPVRLAIDWHGSRLRGLLRPGMSVVATVLTGGGPSPPGEADDADDAGDS